MLRVILVPMSKESLRNSIVRFGAAAAFVGSAAACAKESDNPNVNHYSVPPGQCETISNGIELCNLEGSNKRYAEFLRLKDGRWENIGVTELEPEIEYFMYDELLGLSLELDKSGTIQAEVSEPLLSATAVPTSTPLPTPFKIEPLPGSILTA